MGISAHIFCCGGDVDTHIQADGDDGDGDGGARDNGGAQAAAAAGGGGEVRTSVCPVSYNIFFVFLSAAPFPACYSFCHHRPFAFLQRVCLSSVSQMIVLKYSPNILFVSSFIRITYILICK